MRTHKRLLTCISLGFLSLLLALTVSSVLITHAVAHASIARVTTINRLARISVVGSTAFIVDGHGKVIAVDPNPYGVVIVPSTPGPNNLHAPGALSAGDIIVTNIGANDTGTTLVRFPAQMGPGHLFNTGTNPGTKGPAMEAFNTVSGDEWVANVSGNNVQVFTPSGSVLKTITDPFLNKPWGVAFNHATPNPQDGSTAAFFVTNVADATIDRIDIIRGHDGTSSFKVYQIGQLDKKGKETKIALIWVRSLQVKGTRYSDVLLALDPAHNRIAAYANSSTRNTTPMRSRDKGITAFQGQPLNAPIGLSFNPLGGDLLVVNQNDNNLVELNLRSSRVVGIRLLDNVPVDQQTGNGSALIGVAATTDARGNLEVFFTDDNTNTLDVLSSS